MLRRQQERRNQHEEDVATRLQALYRGHVARRHHRQIKEQRESAAKVVQASYRRHRLLEEAASRQQRDRQEDLTTARVQPVQEDIQRCQAYNPSPLPVVAELVESRQPSDPGAIAIDTACAGDVAGTGASSPNSPRVPNIMTESTSSSWICKPRPSLSDCVFRSASADDEIEEEAVIDDIEEEVASNVAASLLASLGSSSRSSASSFATQQVFAIMAQAVETAAESRCMSPFMFDEVGPWEDEVSDCEWEEHDALPPQIQLATCASSPSEASTQARARLSSVAVANLDDEDHFEALGRNFAQTFMHHVAVDDQESVSVGCSAASESEWLQPLHPEDIGTPLV